jgi:putative restriction endonuclease
VSRLDRAVWNEFFEDWESMAYESEKKAEEIRTEEDTALKQDFPDGRTRDATVRARVNQNFFRKMILASYNSKCCITGLPVEKLLVASHIIPWAEDSKNRLNPQNGLCLNALHDKAFDCGLITIDKSYRVVLSKEIAAFDETDAGLIRHSGGVQITLPNRFVPTQDFLEYHRQNVFVG